MIERVLILGGTGYLGSRLAWDLARGGYRVTVLGRFDPRARYPQWCALMDRIIAGDIRDPATLDQLIDADYDAFINLISLGPQQAHVSPETAFAVDVLPTWQLLRGAEQRRLRRCIYVSTTRVLDGAQHPDDGSPAPPAPVSQYGLTHALTEQVVDYFHRNSAVDAVTARLSSSYGSPWFCEVNWQAPVINQLCCMAHGEGVVQLRSDGSAQRDFVHVSDLFRFVSAVLRADSLPHSLYHVASGRSRTIRSAAHQVAQAVQSRTGREVPVLLPHGRISEPPDPQEMLGREHSRVLKDLRALGCESTTGFAAGVSEVLDYLMAKSQRSDTA